MNTSYQLAKDGIKLFVQTWDQVNKPKAVICLIHGLGEHSSRYHHVAEFFNDHGYLMTAMDLRGHGKSSGQRGHSPSIETILDDIHEFIQDTEKKYPSLPLFIYGHSLGGLLTLNYALRYSPQIKGLVVTSPNLAIAQKVAPWKLTLGKICYSVLPKLSMPSGLDVNNISRNRDVVDRYIADPLVHGMVSARFALDFIKAGSWALTHASDLNLPLLLMVGSGDQIVSGDAVRSFVSHSQNTTYKEWEGCYHEIHNEAEKGQLFDYTLTWLESQLAI